MSTLQNEIEPTGQKVAKVFKLERKEAPAGEVVTPNLWGATARIKNLGNAITEMAGGKLIITAQEVATIFAASESAIRKIPEKKLNRLKNRGDAVAKYTAFDLAHYCVHNPDCKVLGLGKGK